MILDDLITHVTVATTGWLREKDSAGAMTLAWSSHNDLLSIARSTRPSSGLAIDGLGWRYPLFRKINEIGDLLVSHSLSNLESMRTSGVRFLFASWYEADQIEHRYEPLDEFIPMVEFYEAFKLTPRVRDLPVSQQRPFVQALELACDRELTRVHLSFAKEDGADELITQRSQELDEAVTKVSKVLSTLGAAAKALFPVIEASVFLHGAPYHQIPTRIAARADQDAVTWTANLYERVAEELSTYLEVDPATPSEVLAATEAAWATLRECGQTFSVLASWLRACTITEAARRCPLCYRHLGPNMKHFCVEHKRTSKKRQPARDLHVSTVYQATHKEFIKCLPDIEDLFGSTALLNIKADESLKSTAERCVDEKLVVAAANLAALLRQLYPVIAPVLQDRIAVHFKALLDAANEPFTGKGRYSTIESWRVSQIKTFAPKWLNIYTFFVTFYGDAMPGNSLIVFNRFKGLDVDHPLVHGQSVLPRKLAIDLSHLKCWQAADDRFDQRFYLSMATVSNLRGTVDPISGRQRSLADIGQEVGASREAVREILDFSLGLSPAAARRDRLLRSKKELLSEPIDLVAPKFPEETPLVERPTSLSPKKRGLFLRRQK